MPEVQIKSVDACFCLRRWMPSKADPAPCANTCVLKSLAAQSGEGVAVAMGDGPASGLMSCIHTVNPHHGLRTSGKSFRQFPVSNTPFVIVSEYDDAEIRVLFILHKRADRSGLDPASVDW